MTKELETLFHFQLCISSLAIAKNILEVVKKEGESNPLFEAAFKFALVEYSKPYKQSYGSTGKFILDTSYIPNHLLELHTKIVDARDQIIAHSDITVMDPQIEGIYGDIAKGSYKIVTGLEELPNLDRIIELIEATLSNINMTNKEETLRNQIFINKQ